MIPVLRWGEAREFRSVPGTAARTVTTMTTTAPRATGDPAARSRAAGSRAGLVLLVDVSIALVALTAVALLAEWWADGSALYNAVVAVAAGASIALHRVRPGLALSAALVLVACALVATTSDLAFNPVSAFAGAVAVFGATAYGRVLAHRAAMAVALTLAAVMLVDAVGRAVSLYGEGFAAILQGAAFLLLPLAALVPWLLGLLVRGALRRRALSAEVEEVSVERDAALTLAELEAERTRIARDVHDIVAHSLTVVIAQADGARYANADAPPGATTALATIAEMARDALVDVRVLLTELRHTQDPAPRRGLLELDALLAATRDLGLRLEVLERGRRGRLSEVRQLALYRIVQEALTNALRHGDGSAELVLDWGAEVVEVVISNPIATFAGAAAAADDPVHGHGVTGMLERAALAGGDLRIVSGDRFTVRAALPLDPEQAPPAVADPAGASS